MSRLRSFSLLVVRLAFFAALALSVHVALSPPGGDPLILIPWDKAEHVLVFLVLSVLALAAFPRAPVLVLAALLALLGGAIEFVQAHPLVGRDGEFADWLADLAGIAAGLSGLVAAHLRSALRRGGR